MNVDEENSGLVQGDIVERNVRVEMERRNLDALPDDPVPPGYGVKWYESGDEQAWLEIHWRAEKHISGGRTCPDGKLPGASRPPVGRTRRGQNHPRPVYTEISLDRYRDVFGADENVLAARQCFLIDTHRVPIATATAWYSDDFHGESWGQLHWVAVVPSHQRRGLSKPLLAIVLARLAELGHKRAFLLTSTARIPAISLYQKYGFRPAMRTAEDRDAWRQLNSWLPRPFDLAGFLP